MSTMTPEKRKAAQLKAAATRAASKARKADLERFNHDKARRLVKLEAMANDERCEPNTRAIAIAKAAELRAKRPPWWPPPLPDKLPEWIAARQARRSR